MNKYIVIYHAPADSWKTSEEVSKEDMQKGMEEWMAWAHKCGDKLVDMGTPLMHGQKLTPDGGSAGSDREVAGYSILQAENMDEAKSLLQGHPHLAWNAACTIEVHEAAPLPGQ